MLAVLSFSLLIKIVVRLSRRPHCRRCAPPSSARATSKPSARAIGAPALAELACAAAVHAHLGHAPAEVARGEHRGEARRADRRQDVVRAGHVVAERRRARRAHEQTARRADPRRLRLDVRADQLQVLGRELVGELRSPASESSACTSANVPAAAPLPGRSACRRRQRVAPAPRSRPGRPRRATTRLPSPCSP